MPDKAPAPRAPGPGPWPGLTARELGPIETRHTGELHRYKCRWAWPPSFRGTVPWQRLRWDVQHHGIREPLVVLADGQVIDGAHRWDLAKEFNLSPVPVRVAALPLPLSEADQLRVEGFAVASAVARRHLDPVTANSLLLDLFQGRAEIQARREASLENLKRGSKPGRAPGSGHQGTPTVVEVAKTAGVSPRHAERLARIASHGSPELQARVRTGEVSARKADFTLRESPAAAKAAERLEREPPQAHRELDEAVNAFLARVDAVCAAAADWPAEGRAALWAALTGIEQDLRETAKLVSQQEPPPDA